MNSSAFRSTLRLMRRSGILPALSCRLPAYLFACLSLVIFSLPAKAQPALSPIELDFSDTVIYCSIDNVDTAPVDIQRVLDEGTQLTFRWEIIIERDVDYWTDEEIGSITLTRRVVPDIVSRQWLLKDENSGIVRRTASLKGAVEFLNSLKLFPAIDRSLIQPDTLYHIRIKLLIHEGKEEPSWWEDMLHFSRTVGTESFQLP